jgi:DNA polymerase III subunit gamma/tau
MGQALYRKYRSKNLAEIVGQEPITRALSRALSNDKISHAYLFTGPRGVGKTSIARILAHEVNKLPYDEAATHLDIIEIDAASNRRIDEIRDLRDKVHVAPTSATYKVYIVDEVHMLTKEAFNALLKTLEEPPAHVIFILATTEVHKLPETIVSRTQHYAFKSVSLPQVVTHLADIAKSEKLKIDTDALKLIADHGRGSFRDSISLLDQVRNYGDKITRADVEAVLGVAPEESIENLITAISSKDAPAVVNFLQNLRGQGVEATTIASQLGTKLRESLVAGSTRLGSHVSIALQRELLHVPESIEPFIELELCLLAHTFAPDVQTTPVHVPPAPTATSVKPALAKKAAASVTPTPAKTEPALKAASITKKDLPGSKEIIQPEELAEDQPIGDSTFTLVNWPEVLDHIKVKYNTVYGVLRMSEPRFQNGELTLCFKFAFHQKRINDPKNKAIIIDAIKQISGGAVVVHCIVEEAENTKIASSETAPTDLGTISNIFGGAELLES